MDEFGKQEQKDIIKEAFKEWLDSKYAEFGRWALKSLGALILGSVLVFLVKHGLIK